MYFLFIAFTNGKFFKKNCQVNSSEIKLKLKVRFENKFWIKLETLTMTPPSEIIKIKLPKYLFFLSYTPIEKI